MENFNNTQKVKASETTVLEIKNVEDYTKYEGNSKFKVTFKIIESLNQEDNGEFISQYYVLSPNLFFTISALITGAGFVETDTYKINGQSVDITRPPKNFELKDLVGKNISCSIYYRGDFLSLKNIKPLESPSGNSTSQDMPF